MNAAQHELNVATRHILRAHGFTSTSAAAVGVMSDLVSRFLDILILNSVEWANLAGRSSPNAHDAMRSLNEIGVDVTEIFEWYKRDGAGMLRYGRPGQENHLDLSEALKHGYFFARDDAVLYHYRQLSSSHDEDSPASPTVVATDGATLSPRMTIDTPESLVLELDIEQSEPKSEPEMQIFHNHTHGFLPILSPKKPHSHESTTEVGRDVISAPHLAHQTAVQNPVTPSTPLYIVPTPYEESLVAQEHSFPLLPPQPERVQSSEPVSTHPFLLIAMQTAHELANAGNANPARLSISASMSSTAASRYAASDSLFASSAPPPLRHQAPAPSYPIPEDSSTLTSLFPSAATRSIECIMSDPFPSHLPSHLAELSERVVKPGVQERSTILTPPPAFVENGVPYLYGRRPVRAPWSKQPGQHTRADSSGGLTEALLYYTWPLSQRGPEDELARGKG